LTKLNSGTTQNHRLGKAWKCPSKIQNKPAQNFFFVFAMFFQIIFWVQAGMKSGETHLYNQNIKAQVFPNLDLFKILFVSKLA